MRTPQNLKREPSPHAPTKGAESDSADPTRTRAGNFAPEVEGALPTIAGYEVLGELGRGGIGVVYMARQTALNRVVAVKLLGGTASTTTLVRFRQEAEAVAKLQHPNIIQVFEVGSCPAGSFLALEYVEGGTLRDKVAGAPYPPLEAARLLETLARAVHHAHERRLIHRDLKPHNILLTAGGAPKIADFGLARSLDLGAGGISMTVDFVGTPAYAAPEQAATRFGPVGPGTDIYALGVILYELLVGRVPFDSASIPEVLRMVTDSEPVAVRRMRPAVPRDLETICLKCLRKEPGKRYATAAALADDLHHFQAGEPIAARPIGKLERAARWCRRNPAVAILLTVVFTLLTVGAVVATVAAVRIDEARRRADENARAAERDRDTARKAERAGKENLFESLISEAKASRYSRRVGQRFNTLTAIRKAMQLAPELDPPAATRNELRNLAIYALALPDLTPDTAWTSVPTQPDTVWTGPLVAPNYRWATYAHQSGAISIRRVGTGPNDCGEVALLKGFGKEVELRWTPDGRFLGAWHWDARIQRLQVWRIGEAPSAKSEGFGAPDLVVDVQQGVEGFAFASDSRTVFVVERRSPAPGAPEQRVGLTYDLETGGPLRGRPLPNSAPLAVALHPSRPAVAISQTARTDVIDLNTGAIHSLPVSFRGTLIWYPREELLAGAVGPGVEIWDVARRRRVAFAEHQGGGVGMSLNATGDLMATHTWAGRLRLWNPLTNQKLLEIVGTGAIGPDDRLGIRFPGADAGAGPLTRVEAGREYRSVPVGLGRPAVRGLNGCSIHPNGRLLAVSTYQGFSLIDLTTATERAFVAGQTCFDALFDPDGALLVTTNTGLYRWPVAPDSHDPNGLRIGPPELLRASATGTVGSSAGGLLVTPIVNGNRALAWPADHPHDAVSFSHPDCRHAAVSPDGKWVVTGSWGGRGLKVWDARSGRLFKTLMPELSTTVPSFSPDGKWLVESRGLRWRVGDWSEGPRPPAGVSSERFSPDGRYLALAGKGFVVLTETDTGRELARFEDPYQDGYIRLIFSPDGTLLVGVTDDSACARIWDLRKIRAGLVELGLDWEALPFEPGASPDPRAAPLSVTVDGEKRLTSPIRTPQADRESALTAVWLNPLDSEGRLALGEALLAQGRVREANDQLTAALVLHPDQTGGYRLRAQARYRLRDWDGCRLDAEKVLAQIPDEPQMRGHRAMALVNLERFADALPELTALIANSPNDAGLTYWRGEAHQALGKVEEAVADWKRAAQLASTNTTPVMMNNIAWRLLVGPPAVRDPKRALELARQVSARAPATAAGLNTLGLAQYRNGLFKDAVLVLNRSLVMGKGQGPSDGYNLFVLAMCQAQLGDRTAARDCFDRAVEWVAQQDKLAPRRATELQELRTEAETLLRAVAALPERAPPPREKR
jgi:WD40 repeat protein/Flp pilus assembly protein TadD